MCFFIYNFVRLCSSAFGVLWTCLCLPRCFVVTISFSMYLLLILNRYHTLSTFICYQFCIESTRSHQWCSLKKRCSLKLCNIFRKTPVLGSLFNKVVGLQDCKYIKKRLQHRCFVRHLRKFLRTSFLKNICERLLL